MKRSLLCTAAFCMLLGCTGETGGNTAVEEMKDGPVSLVHYNEEIEQEYDIVTWLPAVDEEIVPVYFFTEETVYNFRIHRITVMGTDEDGRLVFDAQEMFALDELEPEHPLLAAFVFTGDLPENAVSYTDQDGNERWYTVEISGENGSVIMTELN